MGTGLAIVCAIKGHRFVAVMSKGNSPERARQMQALGAEVVPLREPDSVDVKVRLGAGMRPTNVQAILDEKVTTPTRDSPRVLLEEVDGEALVVRIRATPENPRDGARLADEIVDALMTVTQEHSLRPGS